jgi:pectate lyase
MGESDMKQAGKLRGMIPVVVLTFCLTSTLYSQQLAFPTTEGYGKYAVGGRGGTVYEVATLSLSGPGSPAAAIGASGPRIEVFCVAGTIEGSFNIRNDRITIAGQSAPGDGICIKGDLSVSANDVIIRYTRESLKVRDRFGQNWLSSCCPVAMQISRSRPFRST